MDKVSVIMPCYNDGAYIQESVTSVLNQTYKNIELIIINDGSTDETTNRILSEKNWPNTQVLNCNNLGPAGARNIGIEHATGKYILPLDSDDLIEPNYIEKAVKILMENPNIGVVYCMADFFGEQSGQWELPEFSLEKMLVYNIVFVTAVFYKSDWEKVGGFNVELKAGLEDYDFWLSMLEIGRDFHRIPETLFHYRIKKASRNKEFMNSMKVVTDTYIQIYRNHPVLFEKYRDMYAEALRIELIHQLFENKALGGIINIMKKFKKIPFAKKVYKFLVERI